MHLKPPFDTVPSFLPLLKLAIFSIGVKLVAFLTLLLYVTFHRQQWPLESLLSLQIYKFGLYFDGTSTHALSSNLLKASTVGEFTTSFGRLFQSVETNLFGRLVRHRINWP